ncbi:MAG: hypothetical protein QNJ44_00815 [Rhodobacter sp.]|nr:hypothetical protein [Rhodobacter sp.]
MIECVALNGQGPHGFPCGSWVIRTAVGGWSNARARSRRRIARRKAKMRANSPGSKVMYLALLGSELLQGAVRDAEGARDLGQDVVRLLIARLACTAVAEKLKLTVKVSFEIARSPQNAGRPGARHEDVLGAAMSTRVKEPERFVKRKTAEAMTQNSIWPVQLLRRFRQQAAGERLDRPYRSFVDAFKPSRRFDCDDFNRGIEGVAPDVEHAGSAAWHSSNCCLCAATRPGVDCSSNAGSDSDVAITEPRMVGSFGTNPPATNAAG